MGQPPDKADYQSISGAEREAIQVQCHSGYTYAERPESFIYRNERYQVSEVEREWQESGERHFRVLTGDRKIFKLCYNDQIDKWFLEGLG